MSVTRFVTEQRTFYRVPVAFTCALLGLSVSWFYKWRDRHPTAGERRRARLDAAVAAEGWTVTEETVPDSMRRQGLVARIIKRRNGLTKQDKDAPKFPDLIRRDFTAAAPNTRRVGDRRRHNAPHDLGGTTLRSAPRDEEW